jgi:hypothetical protein
MGGALPRTSQELFALLVFAHTTPLRQPGQQRNATAAENPKTFALRETVS